MTRRSIGGTILSVLVLFACAGAVAPAEDASRDADGTDSTELFHRGQQAAKNGDTVRAEQYLSMAIERGYSEKKVLPIMLRVCLSSSRLRAALNHAEPYLREHPNDQGLRYLVATLYLSLGQLDDARVELNHLLRIDSKFADAEYLLGVLESNSSPTEAELHFESYLALAPSGDHASEVRSRLTNLRVRVDLAEPAATRIQPAQVRRAEWANSSQIPLRLDTPTDPSWFGEADESVPATAHRGGEP